MSKSAERIIERMEAEIRPLIENDMYDKPPGYNCCGCSTYDQILDHAIRIVREENPGPSQLPPPERLSHYPDV